MKNKNLEDVLRDVDFSKNSSKEFVYEKTIKNIKRKEEDNMKSNRKFKHIATAAALSVVLAGGLFTQTAFGKDLCNKILYTLNLKNSGVIVYDNSGETITVDVPENLKGRIFDKKGNPILTVASDKEIIMYNAEGEQIVEVQGDKLLTQADISVMDSINDPENIAVEDLASIEQYINFTPKTPSVLPEGFEFLAATTFKGEAADKGECKYLTMYYKNNETDMVLEISERFIDETTSWYMDAEEVEEVEINGVKGRLIENSSFVMDLDDVNVYVSNTKYSPKSLSEEYVKSVVLETAENIE